MKCKCNYCGVINDFSVGKINAAKKKNAPLYCDRKCAGLGRRSNKSESQKKKEKAEYDAQYRVKNKSIIQKNKREYFKKDYAENPEKYRLERERRAKSHSEYIKSDKYRAYKKEYDKKYRAKLNFGEFWESSLILNKIEDQIPNREVKQQNGLINKSQKRKRNYEKAKCKELERIPLGNIK